MFGNIFGNLEEKQQEIKDKLNEIEIEAQSGEEQVKFTLTAGRQIKSIDIVDDLISLDRKEELLDLILVALQDGLDQAAAKEQELSQNMINDMLPGMGNLSGLGDLFK